MLINAHFQVIPNRGPDRIFCGTPGWPHYRSYLNLRSTKFYLCNISYVKSFEPSHEKTNNLHMRKQGGRSAVQ